MNIECAAFHEQYFRDRADDYGPNLRAVIEGRYSHPRVRYVQAQRMRRRFREEMTALANRVDALLTPHNSRTGPQGPEHHQGDPQFQSPWTSSGLPTVTIPSGLSESGLPLGIQLAGPPFGGGAPAGGGPLVRVGPGG